VLAGVLGTLLAAGLAPLDAAGVAAFVHGRAATAASQGLLGRDGLLDHRGLVDHRGGSGGSAAGGPVLAGDVVAALPGVVAGLLGGWGRLRA
jgi:hypothetical protein